jgi:hypothetical protein
MTLKTLLCCGHNAFPQHWIVLRATYTLNTPKIMSSCLGGCRQSIGHVYKERKASCGALGAISAGSGHDCGGCDVSCVSAKASENAIKTLKLVVS